MTPSSSYSKIKPIEHLKMQQAEREGLCQWCIVTRTLPEFECINNGYDIGVRPPTGNAPCTLEDWKECPLNEVKAEADFWKRATTEDSVPLDRAFSPPSPPAPDTDPGMTIREAGKRAH